MALAEATHHGLEDRQNRRHDAYFACPPRARGGHALTSL